MTTGGPSNTFRTIDKLRDFEPHCVDPLMTWIRKRDLRPVRVALVSFAVTAVVASLGAALSGNGFWAPHLARSTWRDFATAFSEPPANTVGDQRVPLLRDYASLIAILVIPCAPWFIYSLFNQLATIHSILSRNKCLEISSATTDAELENAIVLLNFEIKKYSRPTRVATVGFVSIASMALTAAWNMRKGGFLQLTNPGDGSRRDVAKALYENWWARPYRLGYFVWVLVGAFGVYMVYVEAVVGLKYVRFLYKNRHVYRFKANHLNPDGYYGWAVLRRAFTWMFAGVATSAISLFPVYQFVRPNVPRALMLVVMFGYMGVVLYVSLASAIILRGHVAFAKSHALEGLVSDIEALPSPLLSNHEALLRRQVLIAELDSVRSIPRFPVASRWTWVAIAVAVIGLCASIAQIISVVHPAK